MPLQEHTLPELLRSPLEELVLQAALMGVSQLPDFLQEARGSTYL